MSVIALILKILLRGMQLLIFARIILAFFPANRKSIALSVPYAVTEPVVMPVRSLLFMIGPIKRLPLDISPVVVFALIELLIALI